MRFPAAYQSVVFCEDLLHFYVFEFNKQNCWDISSFVLFCWYVRTKHTREGADSAEEDR